MSVKCPEARTEEYRRFTRTRKKYILESGWGNRVGNRIEEGT
jgi:hypothetical protein